MLKLPFPPGRTVSVMRSLTCFGHFRRKAVCTFIWNLGFRRQITIPWPGSTGATDWPNILMPYCELPPYGFTVCTHIILNLPWDTMEDVIETAKAGVCPAGSDRKASFSLYCQRFSHGKSSFLTENFRSVPAEEYLLRVKTFLEYVRPDMVIERLFSRIPEKDSVFSNWGRSWRHLNSQLEEMLENDHVIQGAKCHYMNGAKLSLLSQCRD